MTKPGPLARQGRAAQLQQKVDARNEMNPALGKRYEALQLSIRNQLSDTLLFYHGVGTELLSIHQKADGDKYNRNAIGLILAIAPLPAESLRRAMTFAKIYTRVGVENLLGLRNKNNPSFRLHWGHILILLHCPEASRARMALLAVENQWDPELLHSHIKHEKGGPSLKVGEGAPMKHPATIGGMLHQMADHTRLWIKRHDQVWCPTSDGSSDIFAAVIDMPPDKYTSKMLEDLEAMQSSLQRLHELAAAALQKASSTTERVRKSLEAQDRLPEDQGGKPAMSLPPVPALPAKKTVKKKMSKKEREDIQAANAKEWAAKQAEKTNKAKKAKAKKGKKKK